MTPVRASQLAAQAFDLPLNQTVPVNVHRCAACSEALNGQGIPFKPRKSFGDSFLLAERDSNIVCAPCDALLTSTFATSKFTGSGAVSASGFNRLFSNEERFHFLVNPPEPPFAVAIITAQRQHVWWMAKTSYDKDLIPLQFGHRRLMIDRPLAVDLALAIVDFEKNSAAEGRPTYIFKPLDRDLKSPGDGEMWPRFLRDQSEAAIALRKRLSNITLGDLWALTQIRNALNNTETTTINACLAAYASNN